MIGIYQYGSRARGTSDHLSDTDYICIHTAKVIGNELNCIIPDDAETQFMNCDTLSTMAENGSLFVDHLRRESVQLFDPSGLLDTCIASYRPRRNWLRQIKLAYENTLLDVEPSYWSLLCFADITFVNYRNALVMNSTRRGPAVFDFRRLVTERPGMTEEGLLDLRYLKRAYRMRNSDARTDGVHRLVRAAQSDMRNIIQEWTEAARDVARAATTDYDNGYGQLRALELKIVSKFDPRTLDAGTNCSTTDDFWSYINHPSAGYPKDRIAGQWAAVRNSLKIT